MLKSRYGLKRRYVLVGLALACAGTQALAQGKSVAASMEVFVFPAAEQTPEQQSQDEAACYQWASQNTGTDPFAVAEQEQANQQQAASDQGAAEQAGRGSGARGALRGAAAGAVIGEIVDDDAGKGAAYGAAAGAIRGRRTGRDAQQRAQEQAAAQSEAREEATAGELENFKKAFAACLQAKDYSVQY
jgi:hypothetical protein